jgi:outer membrane biosynthesis protein TonB
VLSPTGFGGRPMTYQAALNAVQKWRFKPIESADALPMLWVI